jgi:putative oxidoreductase
MNVKTRSLLFHPWLSVRVQIGLGVVFVVAAIPKIADPPAFAHMVSNYKLLPDAAVNLAALLFPWVEILTGAALVLGVFRRAAAWLSAALLVVFIGAIGINLSRGRVVQCGCFDPHATSKSPGELRSEMRGVLLRDAALLLLAAQVLASDSRETEERP